MKKLLLAGLTVLISVTHAKEASLVLHCTDMKDNTERLECYDSIGDLYKKMQEMGLAEKLDNKKPESQLSNNSDANNSAVPQKKNIDVSLSKWEVTHKKGDYGDYYHISYTLRNDMDKGVKLIDGALQFSDLLGEDIYRPVIDKDVKLPANGEIDLSGDYRINQFMPSELRLKDLPKSDIKVKVDIQKVVLEDNTIVERK